MKALLLALLFSTPSFAQTTGTVKPTLAAQMECDRLRELNKYATREIEELYRQADEHEENVKQMLMSAEQKDRELADCHTISNYLLQQNITQQRQLMMLRRWKFPVLIGAAILGFAGAYIQHKN